jgi:hypothetical protein
MWYICRKLTNSMYELHCIEAAQGLVESFTNTHIHAAAHFSITEDAGFVHEQLSRVQEGDGCNVVCTKRRKAKDSQQKVGIFHSSI